MPKCGETSLFKLRVEAGWGPRPQEMSLPDRKWNGRLMVNGGKVVGAEKCWINPGQGDPEISGGEVDFSFLTKTSKSTQPLQNSDVFEFRASPESELEIELNGLRASGTVEEFHSASRELWYKDECVAMLEREAGVPSGSPERMDIYHHVAYKAKIHKLMPESAYVAVFEIEDDEPLDGEVNYRVRVEQRNGQRAWSSPIWVSAGE